MPRGALALVIHSCEAPDGVYLGRKVCEAAVNSLSRLDLAGIVEFGWNGGTSCICRSYCRTAAGVSPSGSTLTASTRASACGTRRSAVLRFDAIRGQTSGQCV